MTHPKLTVWYNTKCPVCNGGIERQSRRLVRAARAGAVEFRDINLEPNVLARFGAGIEDVRRRLHGMDTEGRLHIGADCVIEIWRRTPGDVWLGNLLGLPLLRQITRFGYNLFAGVETTKQVVKALNESASPPEVFISTAGKCFYGTRALGAVEAYPELDEDSDPMGLDFPAELVQLWEAAADGVDGTRLRHVKLRIGIVLAGLEGPSGLARLWPLGRSRGILPLIVVPFRLGLGTVIGSGRQPLPWIHIDDMVGILLHLIDHPETRGRYNAVAPGIVTNREFVETLASCLRRPLVWSAPEWLVRLLVGGERASILLQGQLVRPRRTLEAGYVFRYPCLEPALADLVSVRTWTAGSRSCCART